jgi:hypothetical protein
MDADNKDPVLCARAGFLLVRVARCGVSLLRSSDELPRATWSSDQRHQWPASSDKLGPRFFTPFTRL